MLPFCYLRRPFFFSLSFVGLRSLSPSLYVMQTIPVLNLFFLLGRTANEERWTSRCLMGTQSQVFLFLLSFSRPLFRDPRTEFSYFAASWNGCLLASLGLLSFFFFQARKQRNTKNFLKKIKIDPLFFMENPLRLTPLFSMPASTLSEKRMRGGKRQERRQDQS